MRVAESSANVRGSAGQPGALAAQLKCRKGTGATWLFAWGCSIIDSSQAAAQPTLNPGLPRQAIAVQPASIFTAENAVQTLKGMLCWDNMSPQLPADSLCAGHSRWLACARPGLLLGLCSSLAGHQPAAMAEQVGQQRSGSALCHVLLRDRDCRKRLVCRIPPRSALRQLLPLLMLKPTALLCARRGCGNQRAADPVAIAEARSRNTQQQR